MTALTQSQRDQLANQLKARYQILLRNVRDELENSGNQHRIDLLNGEPGDSGDESMASALADINIATVDNHIHEIRDIEAALERSRDNTFGTCIECGNEIAFNRLHAYPTAKRCLVCQEKREREFAHASHPKL